MSTTRERVQTAAEQLTSQGKRVSVRSIRELLGGGSDTTISSELKTWRTKSLAPRAELKGIPLPTGDGELPSSVEYAAERLYRRALEAAMAQVTLGLDETGAHLSTLVRTQVQLTERLTAQAEGQQDTAQQLAGCRYDLGKTSALLLERDGQVQSMRAELLVAVGKVGALTDELSTLKVTSAEREALALTRAEALSKHLLRAAEEQRASIAASVNAMRERIELLQARERVLAQQVVGLQEENTRLKASSAKR